jgi:hypothetical protein
MRILQAKLSTETAVIPGRAEPRSGLARGRESIRHRLRSVFAHWIPFPRIAKAMLAGDDTVVVEVRSRICAGG